MKLCVYSTAMSKLQKSRTKACRNYRNAILCQMHGKAKVTEIFFYNNSHRLKCTEVFCHVKREIPKDTFAKLQSCKIAKEQVLKK